MAGLLLCLVVLTSCSEDERRGIRLTPTSTVETGVRVLVDNCPGPSAVVLSVRDDVIWQIDAPVTPSTDTDQADAENTEPAESVVPVVPVEPVPGLAEYLVGITPEGWTTTTPLESPIEAGIRYTIATQPDGQSIDFSTPDLAAGLLWDGRGNAQFNPNLIDVECSEPADVGAFAESLVVLLLLGVTAAATVIVALILLLFVITRRFSRVRSIQRQAQRFSEDSNA